MSMIVGLTGGIGSGKSTVAELFAAKGVPIVDTDLIAHELTGPQGRAMPALSAEFGERIVAVDGRLNRAEMRRLAFADASARSRLEAILHPMIRAESEVRCAVAAVYVLLVVPLLVESGGYRKRVDRVLVVDCDESTQMARVMSRSALSVDEVSAIMATQAARADRLAAADDVVVNNGAHAELPPQVDRLHDRYRRMAGY